MTTHQVSYATGLSRSDLAEERRWRFSAGLVGRILTANVCRIVVWYLVGMAAWAILPVFIGWHTTTVMSGSMSPQISAGDLVVVRPVAADEIKAGQVIQFDDPDHSGELRLHRLMKMDGDVLTTKGDANAQPDSTPTNRAAVHGVGFLRVPLIGIPVKAFSEKNYLLVALIMIAVLLLLWGTKLDRRYDWVALGPEPEPSPQLTRRDHARRTRRREPVTRFRQRRRLPHNDTELLDVIMMQSR